MAGLIKCCDCGKVFRHAKIVWEQLGWYGSAPYSEPFSYCPFCDSDDLDDYDEGEDDEEVEVSEADEPDYNYDDMWEDFHEMMEDK